MRPEGIVRESSAAVSYAGLAGLPAFNPDQDGESVAEAVADLRRETAAADAALSSAPEYAGSLPRSFKNLPDWTGGRSEMYGKPLPTTSTSPTSSRSSDSPGRACGCILMTPTAISAPPRSSLRHNND
jgi:NAD(P)H-dependent FMN reductase